MDPNKRLVCPQANFEKRWVNQAISSRVMVWPRFGGRGGYIMRNEVGTRNLNWFGRREQTVTYLGTLLEDLRKILFLFTIERQYEAMDTWRKVLLGLPGMSHRDHYTLLRPRRDDLLSAAVNWRSTGI